MISITPSARLRPSPFFASAVAEGVVDCSVYNNMLLPMGFGDPEGEYWRLINDVSLWDVGCERQVELFGRDAGVLAQALVTRSLAGCEVNQGKYVAVCNHLGTIINDPIILKLAPDRFWISIADSNILFWARAVAAERKLNVRVFEPDVSPLAVQGPKADDVVASIFGDWVRELRYFWFKEATIENIPLMVARSGYSKQGGFELYLMDGSFGTQLWNIVKETGQKYNIGAGSPNSTERIESGLLSYGGDTDDFTNPFEIRLEKYVDLDLPDDTIGIPALRSIKNNGVKRQQLGAVLQTASPLKGILAWCDIMKNGVKVGDLTNVIYSFRLKKNIGYALVDKTINTGDNVEIAINGKNENATITALPFLP